MRRPRYWCCPKRYNSDTAMERVSRTNIITFFTAHHKRVSQYIRSYICRGPQCVVPCRNVVGEELDRTALNVSVFYPHLLPEELIARKGNGDENKECAAVRDVAEPGLVCLRAIPQIIGRHEEHA